MLQQQLARGGVKIKLVQEDLVKWFSQTLNQHDFHMTCFQHLPYEDVDLPLRFYLGAEQRGPSANFMDYTDADVDAAVLAAAQELDEEARVEKVLEAQRVIMHKCGADVQPALGDQLRRPLRLREGRDHGPRLATASSTARPGSATSSAGRQVVGARTDAPIHAPAARVASRSSCFGVSVDRVRLLRVLPGQNPADVIAGQGATQEQIDATRGPVRPERAASMRAVRHVAR